jgi:CBS-domain-containing membrane protein
MERSNIKNVAILSGSFVTLLTFGFLSNLFREYFNTEILVGAFGASTAILFNSPNDEISSYRNMVFGYFVSCLTGVLFNFFIPSSYLALKVALSVSMAIYLMRTIKVFHPAGGAIALLSTTYQYKLPVELVSYFVGTSVIGPSLFYFIVLIVRKSKLLSSK